MKVFSINLPAREHGYQQFVTSGNNIFVGWLTSPVDRIIHLRTSHLNMDRNTCGLEESAQALIRF